MLVKLRSFDRMETGSGANAKGPGGVAVGNKGKGVEGVGDVSAVWNADRPTARSRCIGTGINAGEAAEALSAVCGSEGNEVQASGVISCCAFKLYISSPDQKSSNPLPLSPSPPLPL
ncbi:hypothetical protein Q5692_21565 [Microcoleus sp. C2C3]|uniref:hypothetical protein n=1 Tax=unclassified Microcoleus TaxID=2642155 RepID=UPI002FD31A1E